MIQHSNTLPIGSQLEEYRIENILGAGGFGVTYKAWDTHLETWVAIKEYFPIEWSFRGNDGIAVHPTTQGRQCNTNGTLSYEWGLVRFLDEARVLARIKNVFVVRINRYFRANGTAYIVMDYEDGEPLSALLQRRGILPESDILGLLQEVLPALQAVHDQGYLHRDLKPSNMYVRSRDGCVMLIDFGSARQAIGRSSKSVTGLVTPGYSPPEQYAIRSDRYGTWTDIYALGAVLYRCMSGAAPVESAERLISDSLKPMQIIGAGRYKPELLAVVDKALALRPDDRYQSIAEIWHDLNIPSAPEHTDSAEIVLRDEAADDYSYSQELKTEVSAAKLPDAVTRQPSSGRIAALIAFLAIGAVALLWVPVRSVFVSAGEEAPVAPQQTLSPTSDSSVTGSGDSATIISDGAIQGDAVQGDAAPSDLVQSSPVVTRHTDEIPQPIDEATLNNVVLAPVVAVEPNASDELAKGLLALNSAQERESSKDVVAVPVLEGESMTEPVVRSESEVEQLLRLAGESFDADRLTTPFEDNALTYFKQVLQLDPDNHSAHQGIEQIVERYVELASAEIDKPDFDSVRARRFITRGLVIDANNEQLLEIKRRLDELIPVVPEIVTNPAPQPQSDFEIIPELQSQSDLEMALNPDSR